MSLMPRDDLNMQCTHLTLPSVASHLLATHLLHLCSCIVSLTRWKGSLIPRLHVLYRALEWGQWKGCDCLL